MMRAKSTRRRFLLLKEVATAIACTGSEFRYLLFTARFQLLQDTCVALCAVKSRAPEELENGWWRLDPSSEILFERSGVQVGRQLKTKYCRTHARVPRRASTHAHQLSGELILVIMISTSSAVQRFLIAWVGSGTVSSASADHKGHDLQSDEGVALECHSHRLRASTRWRGRTARHAAPNDEGHAHGSPRDNGAYEANCCCHSVFMTVSFLGRVCPDLVGEWARWCTMERLVTSVRS